MEGRSGVACYIRWRSVISATGTLVMGDEADIRHVILRGIKGMLVEEEKRDLEKVDVVKAKEKEEKAKRKPIKVKVEGD